MIRKLALAVTSIGGLVAGTIPALANPLAPAKAIEIGREALAWASDATEWAIMATSYHVAAAHRIHLAVRATSMGYYV